MNWTVIYPPLGDLKKVELALIIERYASSIRLMFVESVLNKMI